MATSSSVTWTQSNDGHGSGLDANQLDGSPQMLIWNGTEWTFNDNYPITINLRAMMGMSDPNYQEAVVSILMQSFTDQNMIKRFIDELSPTDELRTMRNTIWQIMK